MDDPLHAITHLLPTVQSSVAILSRDNAPLIGMAFALIGSGVDCAMLGRDIGENLTLLSRRIAPEDGTPAQRVSAPVRD
jgi:hypothetical protein